MLDAPIPQDDEKRVKALHKLQVLDTPIDERFERIVRMACRTLDMPIVALTLVDATRQTFKAVKGLQGDDVLRSVSICGHVIAGDELFVVNDTAGDIRFADNPLVNGDPRIGFYAGCPVRAPDGSKIGSFCAIDTVPRQLSDEQLQCLRDMASLVETELRATMLTTAQGELLQQLDMAERAALIDPLTRLWNRKGIHELLQREWEVAVANGTPLALVMADIDHFKMVNDTYGHLIGDEVLRHVGKQLLATLRGEDGIGRVGGEEFLLVLPICGDADLPLVLERIRASFDETSTPTRAGAVPLTLSFGAVNVTPDAGLAVETILEAADRALYAAKRGGRNRVNIATV